MPTTNTQETNNKPWSWRSSEVKDSSTWNVVGSHSNSNSARNVDFKYDDYRYTMNAGDDSSFKRRFSFEEREFHKVALNKARKQAMTELQLPREWIEDKLDELMYKIDPRTQTPANSFFESFQRLRKFGLELRNPDQIVIVDNLSDIMVIDGHEFSREHFYRNNYFQANLVEYYWHLLKTDKTYHPVKVIYHQKKPHLKIGFKDNRANSMSGFGQMDTTHLLAED